MYPKIEGVSKNSDFFVAGFCSCKACIHAIPGNKYKWFSPELMFRMYGMSILQEQKSVTM